MNKICIIVLGFCLFSVKLIGQKEISLYNDELNADSTYIKSYADIFTPRFVIINKRNQFSITDQNRIVQVTLKTNTLISNRTIHSTLG